MSSSLSEVEVVLKEGYELGDLEKVQPLLTHARALSHTHTHWFLLHTHTHTHWFLLPLSLSLSLHTHTHTHTHLHSISNTHTHTHTHTHLHNQHTHTNTHTHTHTHTLTLNLKHTHTNTYTHTGGQANVRLCTHIETNRKLACKFYDLRYMSMKSKSDYLKFETIGRGDQDYETMWSWKYRKVRTCDHDERHDCLLMEYLDGEELFDVIANGGAMKRKCYRSWDRWYQHISSRWT